MTLVAQSKFAQDLLGISRISPKVPSDYLDQMRNSVDSYFMNDGDILGGATQQATILRSPKKQLSGTIFYQAVLNLFGFQAQDVKLKVGKSSIHIIAKSKKMGLHKSDYLKLEYSKKVRVPDNAVAMQALVYFTKDANLIIKLPVRSPDSLCFPKALSVSAFHKRLTDIIHSKEYKVTKQADNKQFMHLTLSVPDNIDDHINVTVEQSKLVVRAETPDLGSQKSLKYYRAMALPDFVDEKKLQWSKHGQELDISLPLISDGTKV